ncbi:hypothetical protein SUGI_0428430 [Cryptomeria japonica]|uniref:low affinity inorganic phosphate transporter 3-like n=1 Tax=Cryptomeria japonica TaxID=3369 RepID=UPI002408B8AF|nr:low affinity inorganic phosphate transporter 3-like [Cryptomeria japonica]GLJ22741.1 hypothetical protein SUGI_0428430 [Cryptomeria japonica]
MALKVLSALDGAATQLYHFSAILIAGMGFFTDAYDLFCIPPVSNLLGKIYYKDGLLPIHVKALVNGTALCGALAGQLFFGWLGDRMGRKKVYGITLKLMVVTSIASGFSLGRSRESVLTCLCFFRFWLGFGVGGDYPLSATIMSEYANTKTRGAFMAAVFAMQGLGIIAGSIVAIIVSACFGIRHSIPSDMQQDMVWRIILMFGAVPAGLTYYWRMKMPETARYTALVARNARQAAADMSKVLHVHIEEDENSVLRIETLDEQFGLFSRDFVKHHGLQLLGTTSTWFFVDVAFYSSNLLQIDLYRNTGLLQKSSEYKNPVDEVIESAKAQALVALWGTLPGYVFTIFLIDRIGRRLIQLVGFFFMSAFLFALAIPYKHWVKESKGGFIAIHSLILFFTNFGPNTTTFIVPAELFPARLRSTCHGISAAAGKAGALTGLVGFLIALENKDKQHGPSGVGEKDHLSGEGQRNALIILAVASSLGFVCSFIIPETMGRSLEENEVQVSRSAAEVELQDET